MIKLTVVDRAGIVHETDCKQGLSLMQTLREFDYGVAAICGGMASCGTCHVYIDSACKERLPPLSTRERELLGTLEGYRVGFSRLSCQLPVSQALDGFTVTIAPDG